MIAPWLKGWGAFKRCAIMMKVYRKTNGSLVEKTVSKARGEALIGKGWLSVVPAEKEEENEIDVYSAPTREELEEKAKELCVGFNKRTTDETLLSRINEALSGEGDPDELD